MLRSLSRHLLLLAAGPLAAGALSAEESAPLSTTVTAERPEKNPAEEQRARLQELPGAINLIDARDYAEGRAATIKDMLDGQPGVFIRSRTGQEEARVSIRGSGIQRTFHGRGLMLLQDGLPLNLADGSFDMQNVDPSAYSRIRVKRGAAAMDTGPGTLGGSIDFVSLTGAEAPNARLAIDAGSFGYARASATGSTKELLDPKVGDMVATATYSRTDGWRDQSGSEAYRANVNAGVRVGKHTENRIYIAYVDTRTDLPGSLTKAQLHADPRQAAPGNVTNPQARDYTWLRIADRLVATFDDATLELAVGWQGKDLDHPIYQTLAVRTDDVFALAKLDHHADWFGRKNRFTLGVSPSFGTVNDHRYVNPVGEDRRGAKIADYDDRAQNVSAFVENEHAITRSLALIAGARLDYSRRAHRVDQGNRDDERTREYFGVSPTVGLRQNLDDDRIQIFTNLSRSYEAPTFSEFNNARTANPDTLDAQSATTFEIGTRGVRGAFGWDVAYYYSWLKNEFISDTVIPGITTTVNARDTRHQGVELGFDANLLGGELDDDKAHRLILRQVAGWNDFRFRHDRTFGDNRIAGIPEFTYRVELTYRHPDGYYLGPNLEYSSKSWVDHSNTLSADSFVLLGFRAGYRAERGFSWYVEGRNLLNKKYAATTGVVNVANANSAQFNPGDGFGMYAGVEYRW